MLICPNGRRMLLPFEGIQWLGRVLVCPNLYVRRLLLLFYLGGGVGLVISLQGSSLFRVLGK